MTFDSVGRITKLLDQLCSGLQTLCILPMMRSFPELFAPLFTYTALLSPMDVLQSLYVENEDDLTPSDVVIMGHLHKFIGEASEQGNTSLLNICGQPISIPIVAGTRRG